MSSDHEQPAPKRQRLDEPTAQPDSHSDLLSSSSSSPSSSLIKTFFTEDATGLFKVLASSIGKRAANEEEVGITEYVSPDVQPFSGIIKHRFVSTRPLIAVWTAPDIPNHMQVHRLSRQRSRTRRRRRQVEGH